MKDLSKVTLCIPTYNAEKTIGRTIESLINQDYPIFKLKIFDNCSSDRTLEICHDYALKNSFIEFHLNEENTGAESNFSRCIQGAEGDFTALVHSDDLYEKNFLSKSVAVLESRSDCVATFCGAYEIDSSEKITGTRFLPAELSRQEVSLLDREKLLELIFLYGNFITCPSVVVRSRAYREKIQNWNGENFKTSADLDVWLRLAELGEIASIKTPLMKYRVAEASHSFRIAKKRTSRHDIFLVLDQYKKASTLENYNFLVLKDQAIRSLNMIRNNISDEAFPEMVNFSLVLILKKMFHSKWHFKMSVSIFAINIFVRIYKLRFWER